MKLIEAQRDLPTYKNNAACICWFLMQILAVYLVEGGNKLKTLLLRSAMTQLRVPRFFASKLLADKQRVGSPRATTKKQEKAYAARMYIEILRSAKGSPILPGAHLSSSCVHTVTIKTGLSPSALRESWYQCNITANKPVTHTRGVGDQVVSRLKNLVLIMSFKSREILTTNGD